MDAKMNPFKKGMIILWSGSIASIPGGFTLCNGSNGTPDLRGRFILGAGDEYVPDETGGATSHVHTFIGDGHLHAIESGSSIAAGSGFGEATDEYPTTGTTYSEDHLPPYYALAYIMKL